MDSFRIVAITLVSLALFGCASNKTGEAYSRDQTQREMTVRTGIVESLREVTMEGTKSGTGTFAGAAVGGVAGSTAGGGRGHIVGAVIGAVIGGLAGSAIEENATKKNALEITVKLDSGALIAVVQEAGEMFYPGDRVRILSGSGTSRVTH